MSQPQANTAQQTTKQTTKATQQAAKATKQEIMGGDNADADELDDEILENVAGGATKKA